MSAAKTTVKRLNRYFRQINKYNDYFQIDFAYISDGEVEAITYMEQLIWDSENGFHEEVEEEDTALDFEDRIRRIINKINNILGQTKL